ncbi:hypothetical protein FXO38_24144 [Capsicum annuum]|nr:hypothetical protein FXO38_24144 [Capsicum annuum]KAF3662764.1 hypothetical protein FXO37_12306 [Capsicum annuum]
MVRAHRVVKRPTSIASNSRKRKVKEVSKTPKRKKAIVDESESKIESKILTDIFEYNESSTHESNNVKDGKGKSEGESKEESESYIGEDEDRRDSRDGEEDDPLDLPICLRDIFVESYILKT